MAGILNVNTAARVLSYVSGGFGHKHSDVGFVFLKDRFSHIHTYTKQINKNNLIVKAKLSPATFKQSRTEHKLTPKYGTSSHGFYHCNT